MVTVQHAYNALFGRLAEDLRVDGWEARQESPAQAYIHVSRRTWGDENMNGIHLEAYILGSQIDHRRALVMLHCEAGCPFQARFMSLFTERAAATIRSFPGGYAIRGPAGSSVCQVSVPFAETPSATVALVATELRRLQTLAPLIDSTITTCLAEQEI